MASDTKTNDLKKLIMTQLKTLTSNVYYEIAADNALYPHIVFSFKMINLGDLWRQDYTLDVDVWDKDQSTTRIDSLCDEIEKLLHMQNLPQTDILPTFYLIDRRSIIDEDKSIKHRLVRFQIQNYER
jgi:hypothetical protein